MQPSAPTVVAPLGAGLSGSCSSVIFKVSYREVPADSGFAMDHTTTSDVFETTGRLRLLV